MYSNNNNNNKDKNEIKKKSQEGDGRGGALEIKIERKNLFIFLSSFLSKIYENRTEGFHRSRRQSRFTHQELRVGTKILEFRQTP